MKGEGRHHQLHRVHFHIQKAPGRACASQVLIDSSRSPGLRHAVPPKAPPLSRSRRKSGFCRSVYIGIKPPPIFCSISIKSKLLPLFKNDYLDGHLLLHNGQQIAEQHRETRPSPAMQTTCRPGWHFCSPIADGIALAIVPCSRLEKVRAFCRRFSMWRSVQTSGRAIVRGKQGVPRRRIC